MSNAARLSTRGSKRRHRKENNMDEDLDALPHEDLRAEAKKLRAAIRGHRDSSLKEF